MASLYAPIAVILVFGPLPTDVYRVGRSTFVSRRRALIMIARIAIVAVVVATWGLLDHAAQGQDGTPYPAIPTGFSTGDSGLRGCRVCRECRCRLFDTGCVDGWLSGRRLGLQHHPNCSCPRCRPRHTWASFDALMWWGKGRSVPALVTTNPEQRRASRCGRPVW